MNEAFGMERKTENNLGSMKIGNQISAKWIPHDELQKIEEKISTPIEEIGYLNSQEQELIEEIKLGKKLGYKQIVWRVVGDINRRQIMLRYADFIQHEKTLRTYYLYRGLKKPVKVVCESRENAFPIHDLRNLKEDNQIYIFKNVLAAEARREYNSEAESVGRMQGFLIGDDEMLVVLSIYPHISYSFGARAMLGKVFEGMQMKIGNMPMVDDVTVRKMNEQYKNKSIAYWEKLLSPISKSMLLPKAEGEQILLNEREKTCQHKELGEELTGKLNDFCTKNKVSVKAALLYTWARILGAANDEDNPVLAVACSGEKMNILPVKIDRVNTQPEQLEVIDQQLEKSTKYSYCEIADVESLMGVSFAEYFKMTHNFMEFRELDNMENGDIRTISGVGEEDTNIDLFISYQLFTDNIVISYSSKGGVSESELAVLHTMLMDELTYLLSADAVRVPKEPVQESIDKDGKKMYQVKHAQIGLYLKRSGLFDMLSVEEIMELAETCTLKTYLSNDIVVSEKSRISNMYIIGDGKLEESIMAVDGMVNSLRIMKEGSFFGIESLLSKKEVECTYTVLTPQAKIVEIDREVLLNTLNKKTEIWIALLEKENEHKNKLQKLWTMS